MKKINKKYFSICLLAVLLYAAKSVAPFPDFSGTWTLEPGKSDIPHPSLVYNRIVINQRKDSITIENILTSKSGADSVSMEKFDITGGVSKMVLPDISHGIDTRYRSIRRSADGQSLIMTERNELVKNDMVQTTNVTRAWALLPTGELMITSAFKFPDTALTAKAVYKHKP